MSTEQPTPDVSPENNEPVVSTQVDPTGSSLANGSDEMPPRLQWANVFAGVAIVCCLPSWLALGARWHYLLDILTSFVWWYAAAAVLFVGGALMFKRWRLMALVSATLVINAVQLLPYLPASGKSVVAEDAPRLRVMTLNVLTSNRQYDRVLELVNRESPDILVLLEVDQRWIEAMRPLDEAYPHQSRRTRSDNFGVAIYSRLPAESLACRELSPTGTPTAIVKMNWGGRPLIVLGAHPVPPLSSGRAASRNADLAAFGKITANAAGEAVLMGDLNITPFSPHFHDLLSTGNLSDTAAGRGVHATWGTPRTGLVLPIDHILGSPGLMVLDRRIGPPVGSDHRAVIVDFTLRR